MVGNVFTLNSVLSGKSSDVRPVMRALYVKRLPVDAAVAIPPIVQYIFPCKPVEQRRRFAGIAIQAEMIAADRFADHDYNVIAGTIIFGERRFWDLAARNRGAGQVRGPFTVRYRPANQEIGVCAKKSSRRKGREFLIHYKGKYGER